MQQSFIFAIFNVILMNRRPKRSNNDEDGDSDSEFYSENSDSELYDDDDETYSYTSSSDDTDDESAHPLEMDADNEPDIVHEVTWSGAQPTFSPRKMIPEYNEPETSCDENSTIEEVFLKLFPKSLFMWIADCTNERLNIFAEKTGEVITPTDSHEIMIVIGCLLVMAYNRVPHMYMYWSQNKSVRNETIANAISRNRFMLIHSKLYFNHPKKPVGAAKTFYTTELLNCFIYTFNRYRSEGTYQSIDEFMVKFKGRTIMKQFMPKKPVKRGMKGFSRADANSGYIYNLFIFEGKNTEPVEGTIGERVCVF